MAMKTIDILKDKRFVVVDVLLIIILSIYTFTVYKNSYARQFNTTGMEVVEDNTNFTYVIESAGVYESGRDSHVVVKGWAVQNGIESQTSDTIKVVLQNSVTGVCYSIPTDRVVRKDVTTQYFDGNNYDYSGFTGDVVFTNDFNIDANDYIIMVYFENKTGKRLLNTNSTVLQWVVNAIQE